MVVIPIYGEYAEGKNLGIRKHYRKARQRFLPSSTSHNAIYRGERYDVLKRMILSCNAAVEVPWYVVCGGAIYGDGNLVFIANG
ncbi:hypothetical protein GUJ93_ZPchr0012g22145 [Zizania palustris]|uniref:Uncharacterized protein n=1 Tax=Zizania palustris TaxID=103762 RepID=A0A8J6BWU1_ZIZPA|nr:hypothetical protein GUJ93_ZPchr0012g22145 [Zizania palustris]